MSVQMRPLPALFACFVFAFVASSCGSTDDCCYTVTPSNKPLDSSPARLTQVVTTTSTPKPTRTVKPSPTPTLTSTPIGGDIPGYIFTRWDKYDLVLSRGPLSSTKHVHDEILIDKEALLSTINREYDYLYYSPSPDFSSISVRGYSISKRQSDIYVLSLDPFDYDKVADGHNIFAYWSPEGAKLMIYDIPNYIVFDPLSGYKNLIAIKTVSDGWLSWSSDGQRLYRMRSGDLQSIDVASGRSEQIPHNIPQEYLDLLLGYIYFSPSGDKIVLTTQTDLLISNSDFTEIQHVPIPQIYSQNLRIDYNFWSPDGQFILTVASNWGADRTEVFYVIDSESLSVEQVTQGDLGIGEVSYYINACGFTPDGLNIIVNSDSRLYLFNAHDKEKVMEVPHHGACPFWLPVGFTFPILEMLKPQIKTLQDGGMSHYLDSNRTEFEGELIRIDNSDNDEWFGFDSDPAIIKEPFNIEIMIKGEGEHASLSISGRTNYPGGEWWKGIHRLYIHGDTKFVYFEFCDGTSPICKSFNIPTVESATPFTVVFLDPMGQKIDVLDTDGAKVASFNLQQMEGTEGMKGGLFPDGKMFIGVLLSPGAHLEILRIEALTDQ